MKLTERERQQIMESASQSRQNLIEASQEIEQSVLDDYFTVVDDESKKKMQELFGTPVKQAPANIGLLLMHQ